MCGFVVQIAKNRSVKLGSDDTNIIKKMVAEIAHRGPDSQKFWGNSWIKGGFCRLAIQDIDERSNQPFFSDDKRFVIFFNGEIYNQKELKSKVSNYNFNWRTTSDTEVLLNYYIAKGKLALKDLRGMFSFLIVDRKKKEVFVARDQLGVKPLYYFEDKDKIYFASEIKAFKHITTFSINENAIFEQIKFRYVAGKQTIYKNVFRLNAGELCTIEPLNIKFEKYFDFAKTFSNETKYAENKLLDLLNNSIIKQTISDVGYSVQLSGGLDSSYITAILSEKEDSVHTKSIELENETVDERYYQKLVVDKYKTQHESFSFNGNDFANNFEKFTYFMDMPIIHMGCVFLYLLSKDTSKTNKVILTGEGSDEVFGGYSWMNLEKKYKFFQKLKYFGLKSTLIPAFSHKLSLIKNIIEQETFEYGQSSFDNILLDKLIPDIEKKLNFRKFISEKKLSLENKIFLLAQECYLQSMLERQDRASMAFGLEARVPFCDVDVYEYVNGISSNKKNKPNKTKILLKELSNKYFNKEFIHRKKIGLNLPIDNWIRNNKKVKSLLDFVTDKKCFERGIFNKNYTNYLVNSHLSQKNNYGKILMNMIAFEAWYRCYIN